MKKFFIERRSILPLPESKISWPPSTRWRVAVSKVSRTPLPQRFTRSLGVPAIFPGSNTFFFARIPDTRYIFHRVLPRSFSRGRKEGLLTQEVRTNQSFATADPHKFFHADSLATEHATESWITMSGITFRLLLPPPPPPRAPRFYNYWFPSSFDAI